MVRVSSLSLSLSLLDALEGPILIQKFMPILAKPRVVVAGGPTATSSDVAERTNERGVSGSCPLATQKHLRLAGRPQVTIMDIGGVEQEIRSREQEQEW